MDDGLALPWWSYTTSSLALPGSIMQFPDEREEEEAMLAAFLQAASRADTAAHFIAGE